MACLAEEEFAIYCLIFSISETIRLYFSAISNYFSFNRTGMRALLTNAKLQNVFVKALFSY